MTTITHTDTDVEALVRKYSPANPENESTIWVTLLRDEARQPIIDRCELALSLTARACIHWNQLFEEIRERTGDVPLDFCSDVADGLLGLSRVIDYVGGPDEAVLSMLFGNLEDSTKRDALFGHPHRMVQDLFIDRWTSVAGEKRE